MTVGRGSRTLQVVVPVPVPRAFDYRFEGEGPIPMLGSRVLVPFGRRRLVGLVVGQSAASVDGELKPVERVLDAGLVDPALLQLGLWCARYYGFAPGELVNLVLPGALRRSKPFRATDPNGCRLTEAGRMADMARAPAQKVIRDLLLAGAEARKALVDAGASSGVLSRMIREGRVETVELPASFEPEPGPQLNVEQRRAVAAILRCRDRFVALLLGGVTGSGKTEVYLSAARALVRRGRQVLVLVPEIGLTPQLLRRIERRLGQRAFVYHSDLSEGERLDCWQAAASGRARVIVGTRSAVFLPLAMPGMIVIDEEHDASFKQQEGARYQGRDVAVLRAQRLGIPVVLGSATPSLESLHNVEAKGYRLILLARRAGAARLPDWRVLDQRGQPGPIAPALMATMERHLGEGGQVLVYRNRRGYAPILICNACGWQADCQRCSAHMTLHHQPSRLQCHHCGARQAVPRRCPDCGSPDLVSLGAGTERLETLLAERFPDIAVHRVDRDSMSTRHAFEELLDRVRSGEPCVLVGTQMLAKGHHLPGVTLAVMLDVDQALFSADFRAPERLAQAVFQVAGRAGRAERRGEFVLQTRHPEHALLSQILGGDYLGLARRLLEERRAAGLPPARSLALLRAEAHQPDLPQSFLKRAATVLKAPGVEVAGPIPAVMSRRAGYWRFQLWLQGQRPHLVAAVGDRLDALRKLPDARRVRWHLDVDPIEL